MKKPVYLLLLMCIVALQQAYAAEFTYEFSQGDTQTIHFENMDLVIKLVKVVAIPAFGFVEFLNNCPANRFSAHIHGNEAGRKEGTVFVTASSQNIDRLVTIFRATKE